MSIREGMLSMYRLDSHESSGTQPALSIEDERFLDKMKEGEQIDGKFSLPLPLRTPDKEVPNNRSIPKSSLVEKEIDSKP